MKINLWKSVGKGSIFLGAFLLVAGASVAVFAEPTAKTEEEVGLFKRLVDGMVDSDPAVQAESTAKAVKLLRSSDPYEQFIAAAAINYALQDWRYTNAGVPRWLPGASLVDEAQRIYDALSGKLNPKTATDEGLRRDAVNVAGLLMQHIGPDSKGAKLVGKIKKALLRVVGNDPEPYVVEAAVSHLVSTDRQGVVAAFGRNRSPAVIRRFSQPAPSEYRPVETDPADNARYHAAAQEAFIAAETDAAALAAKGRSLAENNRRDRKGPTMSGGPAWGGGSDITYAALREPVPEPMDYHYDQGGQGGPALPGRGAGGVTEGWIEITIDLKQVLPINQVVVQTNGNVYTPGTFRVVVEAYESVNGKPGNPRWVEAARVQDSQTCRGAKDEPGCMIPVDFPKLSGRKVRIEFDTAPASVESHVWLRTVGVKCVGQTCLAPATPPAS